MKKSSVASLPFVILFFIGTNHIAAQLTGDFRSKKDGQWTNSAIWQIYNGSGWVNTDRYPNYNDKTITIQHIVTIQGVTLNLDQVVINVGSSLNLTQSAILRLKNGNGVDLDNNGTLKVVNSTVNFNNDAVLMNDVHGSFIFQQTNSVTGKGTLTNKNILDVSASLSLPDSITCNQVSGTMSGGTLKIAGTLNASSGDIKVPLTLLSSAVLNINTEPAKSFSSITNSGSINWNAGTINFFPDAVFKNNSQINIYGQRTLPDSLVFEQVSGTIMGSGSLRIAGTMNLSSGDIKVPLTVLSHAVMNINTTSAKNMASLTNSGIINWNTGNIGFHAGAIFTNSGKLYMYGSGSLLNADNIATALNNTAKGKIEKFFTPPTTTFEADIDNEGSIIIHAGTLLTKGVFRSKHIFTIGATASFLTYGTYYAESSEVFRDTGYFSNEGTVYINYDDTLPKTMNYFENDGVLQGSGQLFVQGSIFLYGTCSIPVTITSTGSCNPLAGNLYAPLTNNGVLYLSTGACHVSADIINNGRAELDRDFCVFLPIGSSARFINNGVLKGGYGYPSTLYMYFPFTNSPTGSLTGIGALRFEDTLINKGSMDPGLNNPGELPFPYNPFRNTSTTNIQIGKNANNKTRADDVFVYDTGKTNLAGVLNLYQTADFVDTGYYTIVGTYGTLIGTFSVVNKPDSWDVVYSNNAVIVHVKAAMSPSQITASKQVTSVIANDSKFEVPYLIFPNPARSAVTIQFNAVKAGNFDIELYDVSGKRLQHKTGTISSGTNTIDLDVNGYVPGVYIINFIDRDGHKQILKFIKE